MRSNIAPPGWNIYIKSRDTFKIVVPVDVPVLDAMVLVALKVEGTISFFIT
jgi:hypothetical protein